MRSEGYALCAKWGINGLDLFQGRDKKTCSQAVFIREDGRGFVVRKDGINIAVWGCFLNHPLAWAACIIGNLGEEIGEGDTIPEAVDAALAKISKDKE